MNFLKKIFHKKNVRLDWRNFVEHFAARARERGYHADIHWGEGLAGSSITINTADSGQYTAYLDSIWQEYQNEPDALDVLIDTRLDVFDQIAERAVAPDASQIFPNIKAEAWLEAAKAMRREGGADPDEILSQPLAGDIHLVYMLDTGNAFRDMDRGELAQLGIADEAALHDKAIANLRQLADGRCETETYEGGIYRLTLDGFLDAALILILPQLIDPDVHPDGIIVAVPARDALIYCDTRDPDAIRVLQEIAQDLYTAATYTISARLYRQQNSTLSPYPLH